jgi:hypothetical protein
MLMNVSSTRLWMRFLLPFLFSNKPPPHDETEDGDDQNDDNVYNHWGRTRVSGVWCDSLHSASIHNWWKIHVLMSPKKMLVTSERDGR